MTRELLTLTLVVVAATGLGCAPEVVPTMERLMRDAGVPPSPDPIRPSEPPASPPTQPGGGPCTADIALPSVVPNPLPVARVGVPYDVRFELEGGEWEAEFVRWLWNEGPMPPGLAFEEQTGRLHGIPLVGGHHEFAVQANDMGGPCLPRLSWAESHCSFPTDFESEGARLLAP